MLRVSSLASLLLLAAAPAHAQHVLTEAAPYQTQFDGYTGAGFAPEPAAGELDSDLWIASRVNSRTLEFGGTGSHEDFGNGASMGGESAGGIWAFGPLSLPCSGGTGTYLGVQPSNNTFTPGAFQVRLQNGTGAPLSRIEVRYAVAVRNDEDRSVRHDLSLRRLDGATETERIAVTGTELITPEAATGGEWRVDCRRFVVELDAADAIATDGLFAVAFELDDEGGSDRRDEFGISDVWVSAGMIPDPPDGGMPLDGGTGSDAGVDGGLLDAGVADAGQSDAGLADAGQSDAGQSDAGLADAGIETDAGPPGDAAVALDGGLMADGGGTLVDAGSGGEPDGGCGCRAPGNTGGAGSGSLLFALGLVGLWIRRRRTA